MSEMILPDHIEKEIRARFKKEGRTEQECARYLQSLLAYSRVIFDIVIRERIQKSKA